MEPIRFETHPSEYRHWRLEINGSIATLTMDVQEDQPLREGYVLKLNSYDLGVDIELSDAVQRLRFEHPAVRTVVVASAKPRCFCSGANIMMLRGSAHGFKVNFCKYTNETRLSIEDASARSGLRFLAALNGACAGGGYELALACDDIVLVDDGNSTVSLPEVPLLGVLPGTGGLTRVVDKRKVRRDRADVFCTLAEGIKGRRAVKWNLVDEVIPTSRFEAGVQARAEALASASPARATEGVTLTPLPVEDDGDAIRYGSVTLGIDREQRVVTLTVQGPDSDAPASAAEAKAQGAQFWPLRVFRELDAALLRLRFLEPEIGLVLLKSVGDAARVEGYDALLLANQGDWFIDEVTGMIARTLKRFDYTSRTFFALIEPGSAFTGTLLELALASDRSYALDDPDGPAEMGIGEVNFGLYPMGNGWTRLQTRFYDDAAKLEELRGLIGAPIEAMDAGEVGLVTDAMDDIDWDDEVRIVIEERASFSPDALTGMEASLRFAGPETLETKIFGRLTAWQNWIFQRPNAVGKQGALQCFGQPQRPVFDWRRV